MKKKNKSRLFIKSSKIKNISIPILFVFTFLLIFFNKTDYFLVDKIKKTGVDVVNPITAVIVYPLNVTIRAINYYNELILFKKENIKLKEEIIRLKKWQILALKNSIENNAYKKLLNSSSDEQKIVKTASVITRSSQIYTRSITINAGLDDNIEKNFAAINERGLIGKTVLVTKKNAKILLITDQNSSVPVKTFNREFYAILKGSHDEKYLISSFIKDNAKPAVGDILVTSGNAGIYPANILVGKVISISNNEIIALPFVDTNNIQFVKIINKK